MRNDPEQVHPLWPAGHLPHKGGDHLRRDQRLNKGSCMRGPAVGAKSETLVFSPLVGEMPGRAEGVYRPAT
ncbi:lytic murein transglycosylase [Sinorhizobium meliloti]|nr:lytic murein transglycosylase [Sinorhizobium meliloti]RVI92649.1 lytic murein transglycosylase [Sinorhizobium meliloti]RVK61602.1 lytic murein transglycosylase [Sinorhizobium meliloti]RVM81172.1 lytic murein transglycosylase [Sinorhizobium meliloti]RVM98665.1 lytic murein transglycosylase [Sinorhizobium meliloti]